METNGNIKWDDDRIDDLARKAFSGQKFAYDPSFFAEVEKMLPTEKKRRGMGYWWFALLPIMAITGYLLMPSSKQLEKAEFAKKNDNRGQEKQEKSNQEVYATSEDAVVSNSMKRQVDEKAKVERMETNQKAKAEEPRLVKVEKEISQTAASLEYFKMDPFELPIKQVLASSLTKEVEHETLLSAENSRTNLPKLDLNTNPSASSDKPLLTLGRKQNFEVGKLSYLDLGKISTDLTPDMNFAPFKYRTRREHALFVQAGFGLGSSVTEGRSNLTQTGLLGFGYHYQKGFWGGSIGLIAEVEKTHIQFQEKSLYYSYDLDSYENRLLYTSFYRADIPLLAQMKWNKSQLNFGPTFQLFIHSEMDYAFLKNGVSERSGVVTGEYYGLRPFNMQMTLGYGFYVSNNLMVGGNIAYQIWDPIKNRDIANTVVSPFSGQVFIRHLIRQKR